MPQQIRSYTTSVPVSKTVSDLTTLLAKHGASRVATDFTDGEATGLSFSLSTAHGPRVFVIPVDIDAIHTVLRRKVGGGAKGSREQAARVAWRVIKDWIDAQLTLVNANMAHMDQVMLPYMRVDNQHTLYEAYTDRESALGLPEGPA